MLANIGLINEAKKRLRTKEPVLIWQYLLFRHNAHELREASKLARERKMRFRVISPDCPAEKKYSYVAGGHPFMKKGRCEFLWTTLHVTSGYKLVPCCQLSSEKYIFAELGLDNFKALWNNSSYRMARKSFGDESHGHRDGFKDACRHCQGNSLWEFLRGVKGIQGSATRRGLLPAGKN